MSVPPANATGMQKWSKADRGSDEPGARRPGAAARPTRGDLVSVSQMAATSLTVSRRSAKEPRRGARILTVT